MLFAALLLPVALLQGEAGANLDRFAQCVARIETDAIDAYEEAMAWVAEGQALNAFHCAALALAAQNRHQEAARRLESLAVVAGAHAPALRAQFFSQAGNAWLLAREPARARSAFTRAIALMQGAHDFPPDLFIDRARAYAMEADWRGAEEDLSAALDLRPEDGLALRLRASARMHQNAFDLAETDALAAVALEPGNVEALLMLGHARESKRTGRPVEEQ